MHLSIKNLSKNFYHDNTELPVLSDISFTIKKGEVLAILGKSGSGKTTLLNIISKIETESSGSVEYDGNISYTPQKDLLLPWRNILENILLPFEINKSFTKKDQSRITTLLDELDLSEFKNRYPDDLSGGMKQKVSLIRSLAQEKSIYLFDESLSAIDFDSRLKIIKKIRNFIIKNNKIGLFVTHNIDEAISIADKIIVFSTGPAKIIYDLNVDIPEEYRDPEIIRKRIEFQNYFAILWQKLAKS